MWVALAVRDLLHTPSRGRGALRIVARTIVWAAALYLLFLALWGLNYRRPRLRDSWPLRRVRRHGRRGGRGVTAAVTRLNALYDRAHAAGWPAPGEVDADLARRLCAAVREAGIARDVVPARPKHTLLDWYFRRAGVDGMTDPFFLETLIAGGVLPFERPFVVAHEWSHLAGHRRRRRSEFHGWLSCVGGSPPNAYSGWLFLYGELARAVNGRDRAALSAALGAGPRADLRAIRDRYVRDVNPRCRVSGMARLRLVPESQSRRGWDGELRRSRASGAGARA